MKKLNKLFAILFAVLGVQTLSAQVNWTSKTNLLTNPSFETDAATSDFTVNGFPWTPNAVSGWTITPASSENAQVGIGNASSKIQGIGSTFSPSEGSNYFYTRNNWNAETEYSISQTISSDLPAGLYKVTCKAATFSSDAALRTIELSLQEGSSDPICQNGIVLNVWNTWGVILVKGSDDTPLTIKARMIPGYADSQKHYAMLLDDFQLEYISLDDYASASESNPIDFSALINNSTIYNHSGTTSIPRGWTDYKHTTGNNNYTEKGSCDTRLEGWRNGNLDIDYYQTINNLPKGKYRVTALAQERSGDGLTSVYIYSGGANPDRATGAVGQTEMDYTTGALLVTSGTANIGIQSTATDWVTADNFRVEYVGPDLTLLQEEFTGHYSDLQELTTNNVPTAFTEKISNLLSTYATTPDNAKDLQTANVAISAVVNAHPSIVTAFASLNEFIALCTEYTQNSNANSDEILSAFNADINTAITDGNAATTVDAINTAYSNLETARQTYAQNAVPVYPYPFDMTFMLPNTTFDSNTDGWTKTGGANWMDAGNVECYNTTFEFSMEYTGLNSGSWEIQVDAFYRYGGYDDAEAAHNGDTEQLHAILYANNNTVEVKSIMEGANAADNYGQKTAGGVYIPNWPSHCDTYFATGCYANSIATVIADGKLKVGIKKETTQDSDWTIFDNFKLIYKGIDVTDLQNALSALITTADAIKEEKMGTAESTALTNALTNANTESTDAEELETMISTLQSAYDNAVVSIDAYATVLPYITKAEGIDASIATTYRTQYDNGTISESTETVFQNLEVATYSYVTKNFEYPVELEADGWTSEGPVGTKDGQHYDGTTTSSYMEQSYDAWTSDAWKISYKYEKTLPEGKYIFKVAGRHASGTGTTMALTVTNIDDPENPVVLGSVNDFPNSDTGLGINKNGVTSFDANDEAGFANNGAGRGWQWRYVKFELNSETTVEVAVNAKATTKYQWMSFCDAKVQMTEETYLAANMGGLDAPTAAAQALVDTKPMGTDENNALKEALAMAEPTTGAALLAKIEALETAVANANAWRSTYNTEKGKLVAALERFEADYNDAENGALDYMNKSRWETVIAKAQAAAVAKDDLTSHANLTTATTELTAALDAATVSVGEYADLKAAITEATTVTSANVGVNAFQKSQSAATTLNEQKATAQGIYDTATADGERVTSETETLTNAISTFNSTPLNAPKENARYNIVIETTDDWGGHAATFIYDEENKAEDGYFNLQWLTEPNANYAQAFTFTACSELNTYTLSFVDHLGTTRYVATQKGAGYMDGENVSTRTDRLRITTDASKALKVQVIALNTDGLYQLKNTEHGQCIGYTTNHDLFTQTRNVSLREAEKANVTLTISEVGWATLILPFDADLPEGVRALTCAEADGEVLTLVEAESLKANTPYLMNGAAGTYTFSGYGLATKDSYTEGMFVGTYVDYQTTADGETYVLQNQNNNLAFYLVQGTTLPWIRANRCYMTYAGGEAAPMFILSRGDETTGIETTVNGEQTTVIYDLMGRKVSTMEKGGIYIVNGKKVVVK